MQRQLCFAFVLLCATRTGHALAQGASGEIDARLLTPPDDDDKPELPSRNYYRDTLIADGTTVAMILAGGALAGFEDDAHDSRRTSAAIARGFLGTGALGYFVAPPIVHIAHGRTGIGFVSLGIRVGVVLVAGAVLLTSGTFEMDNNSGNSSAWYMIGGVTALVAPVIVDAAVLARRHDVPPARIVASRYAITPLVNMRNSSYGLSFHGKF